MARAIAIKLPQGSAPRFQVKCIACGEPRPGHCFVIERTSQRWWHALVHQRLDFVCLSLGYIPLLFENKSNS